MNFIKNFSIYAATSLLNNAIPFLLLPVLTRYLSPSDYGQLTVTMAYVAIVSPLILFGVPALVQSDFLVKDAIDLKRKSIVWIGVPVVFGCFLTIIFLYFRSGLSGLLNIPGIWVPAVPILAFLTLIPQWTSVVYRMNEQVKKFAAYEIFQTSLQFSSAVLLIVAFGFSWEGRIWALVVTGVAANIVGLLSLLPYIELRKPNSNDLWDTIKFGAGLLPHSLLNQIIRAADRIIILNFVGVAAAGVYAVGWQVASIMLVICSTYNQAWTPFLFKSLHGGGDEDKRKIVKYSYYSMIFFITLFGVINLISDKIFSILISPEFQSAQSFVPVITLGFLFTGVYLIFTDYLFFAKKTHLLSLTTALNVVLNLSLNYVLVPNFGEMGVAYAFAISSAFLMVITIFLSQRIFRMPWRFWSWSP
jgi:O-antigen/teichoic acid export membrane protein